MSIIEASDLPTAVQDAELVDLMVAGANARALRVAPCLGDEDVSEDLLAEARLVLVGAIKRWSEAGAGSFQSQTAGPFGVTVDTRQRTGLNLWPTEIQQLQELCRDATATGGAFTIDTTSSETVEDFDAERWWVTPDSWVIG